MELLDRKLLETLPTGGVKNKFKITESGLHFLNDLKKLTLTE
jgi:predicted transcriptional regulator